MILFKGQTEITDDDQNAVGNTGVPSFGVTVLSLTLNRPVEA